MSDQLHGVPGCEFCGDDGMPCLYCEKIISLRSRIHALETALAPINFDLSIYDENDPDDAAMVLELTLGDLRRARSVLSEKQP